MIEKGLGGARLSVGRGVSELLQGAWRKVPPPLALGAAEVEALVPVLNRVSLEGLAWWRIRTSALAETPTGAKLRQGYVTQSIVAVTATQRVYSIVVKLRQEGIEPIVFKGWSLFVHYAEPGLRPAGDVDLAVAPHEADRAVRVLLDLGTPPHMVDVHPGLADAAHAAFIPGARWDEVLGRSRVRTLGGTEVKLLSAEDELVVLCIHCVRHLVRRPIWLCDIAAALETRPAEFDWARVASTAPYASWILYAVLLAERLVGANLAGTPFAGRGGELPQWLVEDVLSRWSVPPPQNKMVHDSILRVWREPSRWGDAARVRLPNKLAATLDFYGGLDERFLERYQARWLWEKVRAFVMRGMKDEG